jgi:DHA1 family bicyclomycin/chloramphenicol resistance-like MFS transporter
MLRGAGARETSAGVTTMTSGTLSKGEFVALLAGLTMVQALAGDIMLPALPDIGRALDVANANDRSLVLMIFGLGFGFAQIVFGPLSDHYGRRAPILAGMAVYVLCSFVSIVAPSFAALLLIRLAQGIAAAAVKVAANASIRDLYEGTEMARITSLVFSIFLLVPVLMLSVGQLVLLVAPWQWIFVLMALVALAIGFWAWARFGETLQPASRRPLTFDGISEGFAIVFRDRMALCYGGSGMFLTGALLGMIFTSQQVYVELYGWGVYYPLAMMIMAGTASLFSLVVARVIGRIGLRRTAHSAAIGLSLITAAGALASVTVGLPGWAYLFICSIVALPLVSGFASSGALSMQPLGAVAGTAAAVFGLMSSVLGTAISYLIQQAYDGTVFPVLSGMAIMGLCTLGAFALAEKGRLFGRDQAPGAPEPAPAF